MENKPSKNLIQVMKENARKERVETQLTVEKLIEKLVSLNPVVKVDGLHAPHSYRGYYEDLAFQRLSQKMKVSELKEKNTKNKKINKKLKLRYKITN